jgi:Holliday junction resolvase RusA-like endonuclease
MNAPFHMPAELIIALPMPPTTNNLFATDRSSRRRFRTVEYKIWVQQAGLQLNRQRPPLIAGKVSILLEVEEPKTARRQDVCNREKACIDLLVSHGVLQGDDQRFVRSVTMEWAAVEGVRITIKALDA